MLGNEALIWRDVKATDFMQYRVPSSLAAVEMTFRRICFQNTYGRVRQSVVGFAVLRSHRSFFAGFLMRWILRLIPVAIEGIQYKILESTDALLHATGNRCCRSSRGSIIPTDGVDAVIVISTRLTVLARPLPVASKPRRSVSLALVNGKTEWTLRTFEADMLYNLWGSGSSSASLAGRYRTWSFLP